GNKYPPSWTSVAVREIFERSNKYVNPTTPSSIAPPSTPSSIAPPSTSTNSNIPPSTPSSSITGTSFKLSHGVVAGIAVGCIAAIVLGAIIGFGIINHRSKSTTPAPTRESMSTLPFDPPLGELPVESRAQELPGSCQGRWEFPDTSRIELGTTEHPIFELSDENYTSHVRYE
ncbi:hypothetical protein MMC07_008439, partial [Pseudocyphellaria aurata]|nr:hypothetical protein [Pseudocyphellaria aurata]